MLKIFVNKISIIIADIEQVVAKTKTISQQKYFTNYFL